MLFLRFQDLGGGVQPMTFVPRSIPDALRPPPAPRLWLHQVLALGEMWEACSPCFSRAVLLVITCPSQRLGNTML